MILVTGATGTVGSSTVKALNARGAKVKAAVRNPEKAAGLGVELVHFDWARPDTFPAALQGVEALFIQANMVEQQAGQVSSLLGAAKAAGVRHVVDLSVVGADSDPGITFGQMHRAEEKLIEASGLGWTFLRPTFFMQNFINFYGVNPKADSTVYLANADGKVTWLDARDIGEVAAAVLSSGSHVGQAITLTGGEALSTEEACAVLAKAFGHKVSYVAVPEEAARKAMEDRGMPEWMVKGFLELAWIIRQGWSAAIAPGVKDVLGRAPRTLAQYAADVAAGRA